MKQLNELHYQGSVSLSIEDLGMVTHEEAYQIQQHRLCDVLDGKPPSLLLCEHPLVITTGRSTKEGNILFSPEQLQKQGGRVVIIDRGGDVTLHAPGQLVIYPIMDLRKTGKDLKLYLNKLEQVTIDLLASFGIVAGRFLSRTGVWVKEKKIASIGIGVKKWVAYHGIGLNVTTDLQLFSLIRPCGMDVVMTSMSQELGQVISMSDVKKEFVSQFQKHFLDKKEWV